MRHVIGFTLVVIVLLFVLYLFLLLQNDQSNKNETGIDNIEGGEFFVSFSKP